MAHDSQYRTSSASPGPTRPSLGAGASIAVLVLLAASYTINAADRAVFPVLVPEVMDDLGFSLGEAGMLATIFTLGLGIIGLPIGYLLDRVSRRTVMVVGILIFSAFTALTAAATGFADMLVYRAATGIGEGMQNAALFSAVGAYFVARRAVALGCLNFAYGLGSYLGPRWGAGLLTAFESWKAPLIVFGVVGVVIAVVVLVGVPKRFSERRGDAAGPAGDTGWRGLATRNVVLLCIAAAVIGISAYGYIGLYPTYLREVLGFTPQEAGGAASWFGLGAMVGILAGLISDRLDPRPVLIGGIAGGMVVGYLLFNGPDGFAQQSVLSFAEGAFVSGCVVVSFYATIQRSVPPQYIGRATGLLVTAIFVPAAFAGGIFGDFVRSYGWGSAALIQLTLIPAIALLVLLGLDGRQLHNGRRFGLLRQPQTGTGAH
jgi:MFS family permease